MYDCLKLYNFGTNFIYFIKTLYNETTTAVINNGNISKWFKPERGVRQGCPISPYLFILAVEILSSKIRSLNDIKGIKIGGTEIKISQLADDTTCLIKYDVSLQNMLTVFDKFKKCAGLKMNIDKTIAKPLGPYTPQDTCGLDWTHGNITTFGVVISGNESDHYILNYKKMLKNIEDLLKSWKSRCLSLKGKVTVINSLGVLWDDKPPKIAYKTLIQPVERGGIKLCDVESKIMSVKVSWVKRLVTKDRSRWKTASSMFYKTNDLNFFFKCNQAFETNLQPKFYAEIVQAWGAIKKRVPPEIDDIINHMLWNHKHITVNNAPFTWNRWLDNGVVYIKDVLDDQGSFIDHSGIHRKFGIQCNFLESLQIRHSIPLTWRELLSRHENQCVNCDIVDDVYVRIDNKRFQYRRAKSCYFTNTLLMKNPNLRCVSENGSKSTRKSRTKNGMKYPNTHSL